MDMSNNWTKHSRVEVVPSETGKTNRRLAIPETKELEAVIDLFKKTYKPRRFSDVAVIKTFVEAGVKEWIKDYQKNGQETNDSQENDEA